MAEPESGQKREAYRYQRLRNIRDIGLLRIEPGEGMDIITCSLTHVSLDSKPSYEALSYTWGTSGKKVEVCCNGYSVYVTENLHAALRRFRLQDKARTLWADAICINQRDDKEKTQQVLLMPKIYAQAERGLIWLGEAVESDRILSQFLPTLDAIMKRYAGHLDFTLTSTGDPRLALARELFQTSPEIERISAEEWRTLNIFLRRPWFSRVWIIQEAVKVQNRPSLPTLLVCGASEIPWSMFASVVQGVVSLGLLGMLLIAHNRGLGYPIVCMIEHMRRTFDTSQYLSMRHFLTRIQQCFATDPRDKIFALMGVVGRRDAQVPSLRPDYTKNVVEVYTDVALHFLFTYKSFALLQMTPSGLPQYGAVGGVPHLPSWVTDWSRRHGLQHMTEDFSFCAGGRECPELKVAGDRKVLIVKGKIVDRAVTLMRTEIITNEEEDGDRNTLSDYLAIIAIKVKWYRCCALIATTLGRNSSHESFPLPSSQDQYPTGESLQEAFWRTLICNLDRENSKPTKEWAKYWHAAHRFYSNYQDILQSDTEDQQLMMDLACFDRTVQRYGEGRRFCATANGYLGWLPQRAQFGDLICVLKGGNVPFLLRKVIYTPSELPFLIRPGAEYYKLVGECYIHGLMEGEAMEKKDIGLIDIMLR